MLLEEQVDVTEECDISDLLVHVLVEVVGQIGLDEVFKLVLRHNIISVPFNTILSWVRVVVHRFVDEDCNIHGHGIPSCVLIINDNEVPVVHNGHQDVVLMTIIVGQNIGERVHVVLIELSWLIWLWNKAFKIFLVIFE